MTGDGPNVLRFPFAERELTVIPETNLLKLGLVPVPNRSRALFMADTTTGRQFVVKREQDETDVRAESIGWFLSKALAIRVPEAALVTGKSVGWASEVLKDCSAWQPDDATQCDPDDLANVFVLDAVVGNGDRHGENVLVYDPGEGALLQVWSIDLGNAWLGGGHDGPLSRTGEIPDDPQFLRGVDPDVLWAHAAGVLGRAARLGQDRKTLSALVYSANVATRLDTPQNCSELVQILADRLQNAERLLELLLDATIQGTQ